MQEIVPGPDAREEYAEASSLLTLHSHAHAFAEVLAVPKNMKLLAIPLFELYDNAAR